MQRFYEAAEDHQELQDKIPDEHGPALPVPLIDRTDPQRPQVRMVLIFHLVRGVKDQQRTYRIPAPRYHAMIDLETIKLVRWGELKPGDLGLQWDPTQDLGTFKVSEQDNGKIPARRKRLLELYDWVLGAFVAQQQSFTPEQLAAGKEFCKLLDQLVPAPVRRFVEALNPSFFSWLGQFK